MFMVGKLMRPIDADELLKEFRRIYRERLFNFRLDDIHGDRMCLSEIEFVIARQKTVELDMRQPTVDEWSGRQKTLEDKIESKEERE